MGVSCWYLLKNREHKLAVESIKIASIVGLVASLLTALTGDESAYTVAKTQPMKLAAMEALYNGGHDQSLTAVAWVSPFGQADYANEQEPSFKVGVPYALSFLATRDFHGYVPGVNDIIKGYTDHSGQKQPSLKEKIARGQTAIKALQQYRGGDKSPKVRQAVADNIQYFGYGYVKNADQVVPNIPINFWAFRVMVGLGVLFILFFLVVGHVSWRRNIADPKWRWLFITAIVLVPLGYICSESGWIVAELGRQPWTIQDMLPTWAAVSDIGSSSVILTFFIFLALFTTMLVVEINILFKQIRKGMEAPQA